MSLVINTNIASITAQRALESSGDELATAMERLSTGSKINSSADDAAGLAIGQRMTAQVKGLNMAVKNAGDGMAMTQTVESALNTISDMLQRMRELAVQSVNATNSSRDRSFLQEEVNQLTQEINRVSATSQFNGEKILDGSFVNKTIQLGMEEGEKLTLSVPSIAADQIGAYIYTGNGTAAAAIAATPAANAVTAAEDLTIVGPLGTAVTTADAADSAKQTVSHINALTSQTGVSATAQTYLQLASSNATGESYAIQINGVSSGNFTISSASVEDAVRAINSVAGATGVTATSTSDGKVLMFDNDGDDITIENMADGTSLTVQKMGYQGAAVIGQGVTLGASGANDSTRVSGAIKAVSSDPFTITQAGTDAGNTANVVVTQPTVASLSNAVDYTINLTNNGVTTTYTINPTASSVAGFQAGIDATDLVGLVTASTNAAGQLVLTGADNLDAFDFKAVATVAAVKTTADNLADIAVATYKITQADGTVTDLVVGAATVLGWNTAIAATALANTIVATDVGGKLVLTANSTGTADDDFTLHANDGTTAIALGADIAGTVAGAAVDLAAAGQVAGTEGTGQGYFDTGTASLSTVSDISIATQAAAGLAISVADAALDTVARMRANLGAIDNRLSYTMDNLINVSEKTEAARSRVEDADFALESARLAKAQVLQQAGTSMLGQANQMTQMVLDLLR